MWWYIDPRRLRNNLVLINALAIKIYSFIVKESGKKNYIQSDSTVFIWIIPQSNQVKGRILNHQPFFLYTDLFVGVWTALGIHESILYYIYILFIIYQIIKLDIIIIIIIILIGFQYLFEYLCHCVFIQYILY